MQSQKYSVNQHLIETVLSWVKSDEIAIPEIQRPFVWDSTKVRDLMDSLYSGYPVGYVIAWRNPNVRLKDGRFSEGKKILIDGQQRVTALTAAILGEPVVNKEYKKARIIISFHPTEERFEVFNPAIKKDIAWIPDISKVINGTALELMELVNQYCTDNPDADRALVATSLSALYEIAKKQIGLIELAADLDIETVTEIFIRINSKGVVLSQADFAMSKIASNEEYGGNVLRKCVDYFCHLCIAPEFLSQIKEVDSEFVNSEFYDKISWLARVNDDLYDPNYSDLLRVAFTSQFDRGKVADLVSLLSGRDFEKRTFESEIAEASFAKLKAGVLSFINETHFKRFVMILKSAGFIDSSLLSSKMAVNFAYIVYLKLRSLGVNDAEIERYVRRWFVFSYLTQRYSGSTETVFDNDIRNLATKGHQAYLSELESAELSDAFWDFGLPQQLSTSSTNSPAFNVYLAAQCKMNAPGFLSSDITVREMIEHKGDIHHLFPKDYLKKSGLSRTQYNQVANYVYMQTEINIRIGNKAPAEYCARLAMQCDLGVPDLGGILDKDRLIENFVACDVPVELMTADVSRYFEILETRKKLMSAKIKRYYVGL